MTVTTVDALRMRRVLGRDRWGPPTPYGPDGWITSSLTGTVIATRCPLDGVDWIHASIAFNDTMPTYDDLVLLHKAVFGAGWAYQVFAPPSEHVNIHQYALHLYGRADGKPALPDFTFGLGTI